MSEPAPSPRPPAADVPPSYVPPSPCASRTVTADDGARLRFCAHGGHVLGWVPAGGVERLWLSRDTGCGPGTAIRGGVPVVWPQFAERGDGPRHGVARDRAWSLLDEGTGEDGVARARLELRSDAATRALFPHPFTLSLDVEASGAQLVMTLAARNDGVDDLSFTAALHTYLRVSSTAAATVLGLEGRTAHDNTSGGQTRLGAVLSPVGPLDLAVDVDGAEGSQVRLVDPDLGDVRLQADGFDARVVWNPGAQAAPGDVHAGGEAEFVCLEPALLTPQVLPAGATWTGRQRLSAPAAG